MTTLENNIAMVFLKLNKYTEAIEYAGYVI